MTNHSFDVIAAALAEHIAEASRARVVELLIRCVRLEAENMRMRQEAQRSVGRRHRHTAVDDSPYLCDLRWRKGMRVKEIAQQTGWSESTVSLMTSRVEPIEREVGVS